MLVETKQKSCRTVCAEEAPPVAAVIIKKDFPCGLLFMVRLAKLKTHQNIEHGSTLSLDAQTPMWATISTMEDAA